MQIKEIAEQALHISKTGKLPTNKGEIDFSAIQQRAEQNTLLYSPNELAERYQQDTTQDNQTGDSLPKIQVTSESTQQATYRLVVQEQKADVVLLNFASAKNAGGGFLSGAKAQEEDLCRSSGLYLCQLTQPDYYTINRQHKSMLYTDHIIYSPNVPFFRLNKETLLDDIFTASVITAPAPNAGVHLQRNPNDYQTIAETLERRANYVLTVAKDQNHKALVLGAWGCGVFRNDPSQVAQVFKKCLQQPKFAHYFEQIIFAIYDKSKSQHVLKAFQQTFEKS